MRRSYFASASTIALILTLASCRSQPQSWPTGPADLTGEVLDVRVVRGLPGLEVRSTVRPSEGVDIRRLRVRVIGSRTAAPGTVAFIGQDGVTQVARADARKATDERTELTGAFVRIWFRELPRSASPTETVAMARMVAIDSIVERKASR